MGNHFWRTLYLMSWLLSYCYFFFGISFFVNHVFYCWLSFFVVILPQIWDLVYYRLLLNNRYATLTGQLTKIGPSNLSNNSGLECIIKEILIWYKILPKMDQSLIVWLLKCWLWDLLIPPMNRSDKYPRWCLGIHQRALALWFTVSSQMIEPGHCFPQWAGIPAYSG